MKSIDEASRIFVNNMVESAVRIGLIFILVWGTYHIVQPFILPVLWGAIIAVALNPVVNRLSDRIKGNRSVASSIVTLLSIFILVIPFAMISTSIYDGLMFLTNMATSGELKNWSPNEAIKDLPLVGERIFDGLTYLSLHIKELVIQFLPQIKGVLTQLLSTFGSGLGSLIMFLLSLVIAGIFMAASDPISKVVIQVFERSAGDHGTQWAGMLSSIIRSVLVGVIGVAFIQSAIISAALFTFHIPAAGLISLVILVLCIAQLPAILPLIPLFAYMYFTADTTSFIIFVIWGLLAGLSDNVLKPLLMGRGSMVPMPVVVIGSLGGMMFAGIIGLFLGAVVLALWWGVFTIWLGESKKTA
ncbi:MULTISPECIES: AI-2E family transporter [Vibrio]|uniref:AI-2E family transporter n=1 Tax=Vibrio casei TaxID=673372 RepID=A0A368LIF5_9VIBR|nr:MULTISPECIES: AI-2E family transporter [Vibrio]RCS70405.1 AI-2E family transporter [Vibrio casei]SJN20660.1 Hipothetical membrane protein [Vibrio casei]HBV77043.1 AI-2E family transporter [Vibrio sp.]